MCLRLYLRASSDWPALLLLLIGSCGCMSCRDGRLPSLLLHVLSLLHGVTWTARHRFPRGLDLLQLQVRLQKPRCKVGLTCLQCCFM